MMQRSRALKGSKNQTATSDTPEISNAIQNPFARFTRIQYPDKVRKHAKKKKIEMKMTGVDSMNIPISVVTGINSPQMFGIKPIEIITAATTSDSSKKPYNVCIIPAKYKDLFSLIFPFMLNIIQPLVKSLHLGMRYSLCLNTPSQSKDNLMYRTEGFFSLNF